MAAVSGKSSPFTHSPASASPATPSKQSRHDLISRGRKSPTPLGTLTFIGLRLLDLPWQYALLRSTTTLPTLLTRLSLTPTPLGTPTQTGIPLLDTLSLSPQRLLILSLATGATAKQIFWLLCTSAEEFPVGPAVAVALFNTLTNTLNTLLYCAALSSAAFWPSARTGGWNVPMVLGTGLYVVGLAVEAGAEVQRAVFKGRRENEGRVCTTGLWGWARHVNYSGYAMWRAGYGLACSGFVWGSFVMGIAVHGFVTRAIPVLDEYCGEKYGVQWEDFKRKVPWALFPGFY